jgi:hypothetical protein
VCEGVNWIEMTQNRIQWRALVKLIVERQDPYKVEISRPADLLLASKNENCVWNQDRRAESGLFVLVVDCKCQKSGRLIGDQPND